MILASRSTPKVQQPQTKRRLAVIVAVDVAGYAGRAEADEAAAVGLVAALSDRVAGAAAAEGGRVFNTAGDGFMLEFPTATGAIAAAEAIVAGAPAPVRVGVHLGEVAVTAGGDLLGHDVNVAARLQALALPNEIVLSGDVQRALRGAPTKRLAPVGHVRLAKMKEAGAVYSLAPDGPARFRRRLARGGRWAAAVAVGLLLAGGGLALWRGAGAGGPADLIVAVRSFESPPGGPGASYGAATADRITAALADREQPTVSRERVEAGDLGGARLVFGGAVERDGPLVRVRIRLDDARAGLTIWTAAYQRPAAEAVALQDQTAATVADIVADLRADLGPEARGTTAEVLAAHVKALDLARRNRGNFDQTREAYRRLVQLTPASPRAWATYAYAISTALLQSAAPEAVEARWRAEGQAAARRARELAPNQAYGYLAMASLTQDEDFVARDALIAQAVALETSAAPLLTVQASHLRDIGRPGEALPLLRQGMAAPPVQPAKMAGAIFGYAGSGLVAESQALGEKAARLTPDSNSVRRANLFTRLLYGTPEQASAAIDAFQAGEARLDPVSEKAWRDYVAARQGPLDPKAAAKALTAAPRAETGVDPSTAMSAFSILGRLDEAFAEAERARVKGWELHTANLFEPAAAAMRKDPRFMPLAARLGLVRLWATTGRWPDFCQEPGLPYDCRKAGAAVMEAQKSVE